MKTQLSLTGSYPSIYNLHFLGICLTLITACSVFKEKSFFQTDSLQRQSRKNEIKMESSTQMKTMRIYSKFDSTELHTFAEIVPNGIFQYSPQEGYRGNAEKVLIHEYAKKRQQETGSLGISKNRQQELEVKSIESKRNFTRFKNREKTIRGLSWISLGSVLLIFLGIYIFRKRW